MDEKEHGTAMVREGPYPPPTSDLMFQHALCPGAPGGIEPETFSPGGLWRAGARTTPQPLGKFSRFGQCEMFGKKHLEKRLENLLANLLANVWKNLLAKPFGKHLGKFFG